MPAKAPGTRRASRWRALCCGARPAPFQTPCLTDGVVASQTDAQSKPHEEQQSDDGESGGQNSQSTDYRHGDQKRRATTDMIGNGAEDGSPDETAGKIKAGEESRFKAV